MPARKSHSKKRTARITAVIERVQALISNDPGQSLQKLASIVNEPIMRIAENFRYKSYTLKMLSEAARTNRIARCNLLLCSLKNEASERIRFFSDEKIFTVDAKINRRNDQWLAYNSEDSLLLLERNFQCSRARCCVQ